MVGRTNRWGAEIYPRWVMYVRNGVRAFSVREKGRSEIAAVSDTLTHSTTIEKIQQPSNSHKTMKQRYVSVYRFVDTLLGNCISKLVHLLSNAPLKAYVPKRKLYFASLAFNTCVKSTHQKLSLTRYVLVTTKATQQSIRFVQRKICSLDYIGGFDMVDLVYFGTPSYDWPSQCNQTFSALITRLASTKP